MKRIILIHGAWQSAYSWRSLTSLLINEGYRVIAHEMPGHGKNVKDFTQLSFNDYVESLIDTIKYVNGKVTLVAHSMGGLAMSAAANLMPERIDSLIYLTALVPQNGKSIVELGAMDTLSQLPGIFEPVDDPYQFNLKKEGIIPVFCQDADPSLYPVILNGYQPEPSIPATFPVSVDDSRWGKIPKHFIFCLRDNAISREFQNDMVQKAGIKSTFSIDCDHMPQLSRPKELLEILKLILEVVPT